MATCPKPAERHFSTFESSCAVSVVIETSIALARSHPKAPARDIIGVVFGGLRGVDVSFGDPTGRTARSLGQARHERGCVVRVFKKPQSDGAGALQ